MSHPSDPIVTALLAASRVLITTHVKPDGDALGSAAVVAVALRHLGKHAEVLLLSRLPNKYAFVLNDVAIEHRVLDAGRGEVLDEAWASSFDVMLVIDTGTRSQLPGLEKWVERSDVRVVVVDHHKTQEGWGEARWVDTTAAAAGEMALDLAERLGVRLDAEMARAGFVAIASDTGWLQFSNTTPATLRRVADLMERGLDLDAMNRLLNQNERSARLRVQRIAMQNLRFAGGGRVALMSVSREEFAEAGAQVTDTENMVNLPLIAREVEVSVLLTEPPEGGAVRASLRSKSVRLDGAAGLDCARFAERFGGGGHARAAGLRMEMPIAEALARLEAELVSVIA